MPLHACRIHLRAVLMLPGWCGGIAYGVCNAAGFFDYLCFPCLPYPARNIELYSYLPRKPNTPPCGRVNTLAIMRRKRDPMSSVHLPTRRTILTLGLSISGTFMLSSCARPEGRTSQYEYSEVYPTPSQTFEQNRGADYSGTIQLGTYEKHGKYVPGTQEHKAQNVP